MILLTLGAWVHFVLTEKLILCLIPALFKETTVLIKCVNVIFTTGQNLVVCGRTRGFSSDLNPLFKPMFTVSIVEVIGQLRAHLLRYYYLNLNSIARCWIELFQKTPRPKCEQILHLAKMCADLLFRQKNFPIRNIIQSVAAPGMVISSQSNL